MAIVAEYHYPNGTVYIDDDCYRDVAPDEMKRRIERLQKTAWELYLKNERTFDVVVLGGGHAGLMAACGAVLAGVVYGCIAGFCPRGDAVICAGMMALCLAYCRASMIYRKRRRQRQEAEARRAARESLNRAVWRADFMRQIR